MSPTDISLLFGGLLCLIVGAVHQIVRPKETRYQGPIWFLRLREIRPYWCYLLGAGLILAAVLRTLLAV